MSLESEESKLDITFDKLKSLLKNLGEADR